MAHEIYGLQVDFVQRQGTFLQVGKDSGLTRIELAEHQVRMIANNSIPGLLYMEVEEQETDVFFRYDITSRKILSQWLQLNKLSLRQFYELLLYLAGILEDSKRFMLEQQNYVMQESFIYIGNSLNEVELVYLPLNAVRKPQMLNQEFAQLASRWITYVETLDGDGIQQLMKMMQSEDYRMEDLQYLLRKLLDGNQAVSMVLQQEKPDKQERRARQSEQARISAGNPRGLAAWFHTLQSKWLKRRTAELTAGQANQANVVSEHDMQNRYYQTLDNQTSLLAGKDATVYLNGNQGLVAPAKQWILQVRRGQTTEILPIASKTFTIGRSREDVSYLDDSAGVSRLHCEISTNGNLWTVKDLGSKNGSFLNGEPMVPYKEYGFAEGDTLKIIRSEYTLMIAL